MAVINKIIVLLGLSLWQHQWYTCQTTLVEQIALRLCLWVQLNGHFGFIPLKLSYCLKTFPFENFVKIMKFKTSFGPKIQVNCKLQPNEFSLCLHWNHRHWLTCLCMTSHFCGWLSKLISLIKCHRLWTRACDAIRCVMIFF